MTHAELKSKLLSLVTLAKTNSHAVESLHEILRQVTDWRQRQQVELAIRHAEKNWK